VIPYEWFEQAEERIAPHIKKTPLTRDAQRGLFIKWENHQVTGSFKPRGALNKVLSLADWERANGLVAASAGNHGQGVALAGGLTGAQVEVFVSKHAVPTKVEAMRDLGAKIFLVEGGYGEAETAGREYAKVNQKIFISPYNDGQVIAGQGTIGLEILRELYPDLNPSSFQVKAEKGDSGEAANWIVPTGGGGLISALGTLLQKLEPRPRLIAVQAAASPFTHSLFHRDTQAGVQDLPTLADGLSGAVEEGSVTIPMIKEFVNDFILVSEEEITKAIAFAWYVYHEKIEGSAAVGLAAVITGKVKERPSVVIVSGGNIQPEAHERIVAGYIGESWT
jgi:threonine dehydratase